MCDCPTSRLATSAPGPAVVAGFLSLGAASTAPTVEQAAKPFDRERSGLVLGSAAVAIVLEREDVAAARRRVPLARAPHDAACCAPGLSAPAVPAMYLSTAGRAVGVGAR